MFGRIDKIADALGTNTYFYDEFMRLTGMEGPQTRGCQELCV